MLEISLGGERKISNSCCSLAASVAYAVLTAPGPELTTRIQTRPG